MSMANFVDSNYVQTLCNLPENQRLDYFISIKDAILDDSTYWQLLAGVWMASEVCSPYLKVYRDLFTAYRRNRHKMMKAGDRKIWRSLVCRKAPKTVKVYRAMNQGEDVLSAISWTLDKKVAQKLANGRKVVSWEIPKECIIAYFNRRKEQEIIYLWEEVKLRG